MESLIFCEYKHLRKETDPFTDFDDDGTLYINTNTAEAKMVTNDSQLASCYDETMLNTDTKGSTKFCICLDVDQPEGQYAVSLQWKGKGKKPLKQFDDHLLQQLGNNFLEQQMVESLLMPPKSQDAPVLI
jgi:hypothetical protein